MEATSRREAIKARVDGTKEVPDPTPVEVPEPPRRYHYADEVRKLVAHEFSRLAEANQLGTFDEEDDFEEDDPEPDLTSPYELSPMQDDRPAGEFMETIAGPSEADPQVQDEAVAKQSGSDEPANSQSDSEGS